MSRVANRSRVVLSRMTGESGWPTGAMSRPPQRRASSAVLADPTGWEPARQGRGGDPERRRGDAADRTEEAAPARFGLGRRVVLRLPGPSRSRSKINRARRTAPTPSVAAWWNFCTSAAPSPTPSRSVNSHSGRARSNSHMASRATKSSTSSREHGSGRFTRRRWSSMSKSGASTQRGHPSRAAGVAIRRRSHGIRSLAVISRAR